MLPQRASCHICVASAAHARGRQPRTKMLALLATAALGLHGLGSNREFTAGPWLMPGEYENGCGKTQSWFCETCCCKYGNAHWRDYKLDADVEGDDNEESLGESLETSREVSCCALLAREALCPDKPRLPLLAEDVEAGRAVQQVVGRQVPVHRRTAALVP